MSKKHSKKRGKQRADDDNRRRQTSWPLATTTTTSAQLSTDDRIDRELSRNLNAQRQQVTKPSNSFDDSVFDASAILQEQIRFVAEPLRLQTNSWQKRLRRQFGLKRDPGKTINMHANDEENRVSSGKTIGNSPRIAPDGVPLPRYDLSPDAVEMRWSGGLRAPQNGLGNTGNTCFLNATLQCLAHTAPFAHYLRKHSDDRKC